jgi:molecular chaperone GrpE
MAASDRAASDRSGSDRSASDRSAAGEGQATGETNGPVIHDRRRIDPVTGQVRHGKHAASKPAGTSGAGRPAGAPEPDAAASGQAATEANGKPVSAEEEVVTGRVVPEADTSSAQNTSAENTSASDNASAGNTDAELQAQLDERTSDLQRLQAEYANYRKRVERDRVTVKEQAVASTLAGLLPALDAIEQAREHGELSGGFKSVADSLQTALGRLGLVTYGEKGDPFDPKIHEALTSTVSADVAEDTCIEILQPGYKVGERILRPARVAVAAPASSNEASWPSSDEEGN